AAGVEDVVDDHDGDPVDVEVQVRRVHDRMGRAQGQVVAIEGDVHRPERHRGVEQVAYQALQAGGEDGAAPVDPDDRQALVLGVLLDDLMGDPHECAAHVVAA